MGRKLLVLLLVLSLASPALAKFFGSLDSILTLDTTLGTPALSSTLWASYFTGEVAELPNSQLAAIAYLTDRQVTDPGLGLQLIAPLGEGMIHFQSYAKQDIVVEWPVGSWQLLSDFALSWDRTSSYLWNELTVYIYGISLTATSALSWMAGAFSSGLELTLQGTTLAGLGVALSGVFGLSPELSEHTLVVEEGRLGEFRYGELELSGVKLGCLNLDATTRISRQGFSWTELEWKLDGAGLCPGCDLISDLDLLATVTFSVQTKSILIEAGALVEEVGDLYFYLRLLPWEWAPNAPSVNALRLTGIGLWDLELGGAKVNALLSPGGRLYRLRVKDDLWLRAYGYYVDIEGLEEEEKPRYVETPYDAVLSLEEDFGNASFALDLYSDAVDGGLFGLGLVTLEGYAVIAEPLEVRLGLSLDPVLGLKKLAFEFKYSLYVY
ncbi:hypothetical protein H5T52_06830 [Candidatus Bipolaricaulota bacterium]|nr:hypothetical protein [Candidatus Bipolaricaulota bacterium]